MWIYVLLLFLPTSLSQDSNCEDGFTCDNGTCVPKYNFCNDNDECGDGSDEKRVESNLSASVGIACRQDWKVCLLPKNQSSKRDLFCKYETNCSDGFVCENGKCIDPIKFCDGADDCGDGSDEIRIGQNLTSGISCNRYWYICVLPEKQASKYSLICDKTLVDWTPKNQLWGVNLAQGCGDKFLCGTDCSEGFLCENRNCLKPQFFCDGRRDCPLGADEYGGLNVTRCRQHWDVCLLPDSQAEKSRLLCKKAIGCNDGFLCGDGKCIAKKQFCDGRKQCSDGYDERNYTDTTKGDIFCSPTHTSPKCSLPGKYVCDGSTHCLDGLDECLCVDGRSEVFLDEKCFRCLSYRSIIVPFVHLCDGVFDCPDLTDECMCDGAEKPKQKRTDFLIQYLVR